MPSYALVKKEGSRNFETGKKVVQMRGLQSIYTGFFMGSGALNPRRKIPESPSLSSPPEVHTDAEVIAALDALSDTDIRYLVAFARRRILGADPDDLCGDAIVQTLKLRRKWRRGVSMRNHLIACMRSIASSRFRRAIQQIELPPDQPGPFSPPELALDARANAKRLREELLRTKDAVALAVLDTVSDGLAPKKAQELLSMRPKVYDAARKRIRRLADKLFRSPKETSHA